MALMTVSEFATELKMPTPDLLDQLAKAGVEKQAPSDAMSEQDKTRLLDYLRKSHGEAKPKSKITLTRKQTTEIKSSDAAGRSRTIPVEVRKKRVFVKRDVSEAAEPQKKEPVIEQSLEDKIKPQEEARVEPEMVPAKEAGPVVADAAVTEKIIASASGEADKAGASSTVEASAEKVEPSVTDGESFVVSADAADTAPQLPVAQDEQTVKPEVKAAVVRSTAKPKAKSIIDPAERALRDAEAKRQAQLAAIQAAEFEARNAREARIRAEAEARVQQQQAA
ncbi:MAG: translation initiation factor IF-2 associated domain-containing protein, partial [Rugosibacter sp.]|nr:translation initiation factor IF-2 associated domain-containing protein [Rugosibacter sp.]